MQNVGLRVPKTCPGRGTQHSDPSRDGARGTQTCLRTPHSVPQCNKDHHPTSSIPERQKGEQTSALGFLWDQTRECLSPLSQLSQSLGLSPPVLVQGTPAAPACGPACVPPAHRPPGSRQDHGVGPSAGRPRVGLHCREEGPALLCARAPARATGMRLGACSLLCPLLDPRKLLPGGGRNQVSGVASRSPGV